MTRRKRIAIAGVAAILLALVLVYLIGRIDASPPDDSDLTLARPDIPADGNGYSLLVQACDAIDWDECSDDRQARISEVGTWNQSRVDAAIAKNAAALELLDRALACPRAQFPKCLDQPEAWERHTLILMALDLHDSRAKDRLRKGQDHEALQDALGLIRFGQALQESSRCLVDHLFACRFKADGLRLARACARGGKIAAADLQALNKQIARCPPQTEDLAAALCGEYQNTAARLDGLKSGRYHWGDLVNPRPRKDPVPLGDYLMHPNSTKRSFVEAFRFHIATASLAYPQARRQQQVWWQGFEGKKPSKPRMVMLILSPNGYGVCVYYAMMPAVRDFWKGLHEQSVELAATRLVLAAKAFKIEKGRLPERLDELVPDYLETLAPDDLDGKPLRFNSGRMVVYSIGQDLQDDGGMTREEMEAWWTANNADAGTSNYEYDLWRLPDPSFPIE